MIEVKNLTKDFKETKALDNVSLRFAAGKIHGLIGRNGSGKTVLLKILCGFMAPTSGEVLFDGKPALPGALRESMGIIIESPGFIGSKSGFVNLWYLASLRKRITKEQVRQAMETVGLDPASKKAVRKYSMGMRQRLGIAQAIMEDPAVILLDEPMNGLDNQGVKDIRKVLMSLRDKGKTVLLASHSREDIAVLCDTVTEMEAGRAKQMNTKEMHRWCRPPQGWRCG